MSDRKPCGRPIFDDPEKVENDRKPVCLMHSTALIKTWESTQVQQEIQAILDGTSTYNRRKDTHDFSGFVFLKPANFLRVTFTQKAVFLGATFAGNADFRETTFIEGADFSYTSFIPFGVREVADGAPDPEWSAIADFRGAQFMKPTEVRFFQANKEEQEGLRARFLHCEIEQFDFTDVHWYKLGNRIALQDEIDLSGRYYPEYELVAKAYRQMVNNLDKARAYDLAEDCFIGAMEMKRQNPENHFGGLHWLSVVNLYRLLSKYGSSYTRAFGALVVFLMLFALLFPAFGLRMAGDSYFFPGGQTGAPFSAQVPTISWGLALTNPQRNQELWRTFKTGIWASLEVATFQRDPSLKPADSWGRRLAVIEDIAIPGQVALLLLALRRRFRR
jgi:hypothetical protein